MTNIFRFACCSINASAARYEAGEEFEAETALVSFLSDRESFDAEAVVGLMSDLLPKSAFWTEFLMQLADWLVDHSTGQDMAWRKEGSEWVPWLEGFDHLENCVRHEDGAFVLPLPAASPFQ